MKRLIAFSLNIAGVAGVLLMITHMIVPEVIEVALLTLSILWCLSVMFQCYGEVSRANRKKAANELRFSLKDIERPYH